MRRSSISKVTADVAGVELDCVDACIHVKPGRISCLRCNIGVYSSVDAAIIPNCQNAGRTWQKRERMLVHVHRATIAAVTAGRIVPYCPCPRCKPHVKGIKENAVGVVRVYGDSLIVPVLRIVEPAASERATLRAFHISPVRASICGSPGTKLATVGTAATAVTIPNDGLRLRVDVVGITRRNCDVDASELVGAAITSSGPANNGIVARCAAAGVHGRTCRVRATGHLITEDKSVGVTGN